MKLEDNHWSLDLVPWDETFKWRNALFICTRFRHFDWGKSACNNEHAQLEPYQMLFYWVCLIISTSIICWSLKWLGVLNFDPEVQPNYQHSGYYNSFFHPTSKSVLDRRMGQKIKIMLHDWGHQLGILSPPWNFPDLEDGCSRVSSVKINTKNRNKPLLSMSVVFFHLLARKLKLVMSYWVASPFLSVIQDGKKN